MHSVIRLAPELGIAMTCSALGVARATYYRQRAQLQDKEHQHSHSERLGRRTKPQPGMKLNQVPRVFVLATAEVHPRQAHENRGSVARRTSYRLVEENLKGSKTIAAFM